MEHGPVAIQKMGGIKTEQKQPKSGLKAGNFGDFSRKTGRFRVIRFAFLSPSKFGKL
jgi:hypothetical protein